MNAWAYRKSARDVFTLLAQSQRIAPALADSLKRMIGFRNIAAHDYQALQLPIMVAIIENHLEECLYYSQTLLLHDAAGGGVRAPTAPLPDVTLTTKQAQP